MKLDLEHPRARCPLSGNGTYTASACFCIQKKCLKVLIHTQCTNWSTLALRTTLTKHFTSSVMKLWSFLWEYFYVVLNAHTHTHSYIYQLKPLWIGHKYNDVLVCKQGFLCRRLKKTSFGITSIEKPKYEGAWSSHSLALLISIVTMSLIPWYYHPKKKDTKCMAPRHDCERVRCRSQRRSLSLSLSIHRKRSS